MTPEVEAAIAEIKKAFSGYQVDIAPEEQGGAYVIVHDLFIGNSFVPSSSWVGFLINFQYPHSDVYPHFIDPAVRKIGNAQFGDGMSAPTQWHDRNAIQVSRRSNRLDASRDTAVLKLAKVLDWLKEQK